MNRRLTFRHASLVAVLALAGLFSAFGAQLPSSRYALILEDPPLAEKFQARETMRSAAAASQRAQIATRQRAVRSALAAKHIAVAGSVDTLLNAVFVVVSNQRVAELQAIPGVKAVVPLRRYERKLNRATQLLRAPAAWSALGGAQNAGAGVKIAVLDSGIDQTHPAFQDGSLAMPAGYPLCDGPDCAFTTNKVIVARSYVRQLAAGSADNPAADSRPDDYSPRDHDGHGTAVASCAAGNTNHGAVPVTGMAPKAYLGNYKIYGSPGVNDSTTDDVIILALEAAVKDGMDIVSFSSGGPAFTGPLDTGAACGLPAGAPCDPSGWAFEKAAKSGVIIIVSAGNEGRDGAVYPTYGSIGSPADAPSVIAVGASTNSHVFANSITLAGSAVPATLQSIPAQSGDGPVFTAPVSGPLSDVTTLGNDGLACVALPAGSLTGAIAIIQRGTCDFAVKVANASSAGAAGVILYMADAATPTRPGGISGASIPVLMVSRAYGLALRSFLQSNPGQTAAIRTQLEEDSPLFDELAGFSSLGPSTGDYLVKPDLVAVGSDIYMAAETYDPQGALYSPNGYAVADGTSFATPLTAGAAALVKQKHPAFTAAQVKSALVNTATQEVTVEADGGRTVDMRSVGAGKLDASAALNATVTVDPATVSFGLVRGSLPEPRQLAVTNNGTTPVDLSITAAGPAVTLSTQSMSLAPGASGTVTVSLPGVPIGPGGGSITLQGSGVSLRVPYMYMVGTGIPANLIPLSDNFYGSVNEGIPQGIIAFRLVDQYGVPVANAGVTWTPRPGLTLAGADAATDANGIAGAVPVLGPTPSNNLSVVASIAGRTWTFTGASRLKPAIGAGGIVNAAAADPASPVAPGSYVSIYGTNLSDTTNATETARLPLSIDNAFVSFDVPSAGISAPGHLTFVSPGQVNVQVPWELQGQSSAKVKVTVFYSNGNVATLQLSDYAPAFFEVGGGVAALDYPGFRLIEAGNPAVRGQVIQLFANGLGPVDNQPPSGEPAPASPLARTTGAPPVVTIGGQPATVLFSGLAPGFAGLYQVNVTVPQSVSPGTQKITIAIGGKTSTESSIVVQ